MQNLREERNTNEKVSAVIEKPEIKNVEKSRKKALTRTERPITIQILQRQKRRKGKRRNNAKIKRLKKNSLN